MEKIYELHKNKIVIKNLTDFNIKHILECGQVFRFEKLDVNETEFLKYAYKVISGANIAVIYEYENYAEIFTNETEYYVNYFDLNTDYSTIKENLKQNNILRDAIEYGYGIRILKQQPLETIISFIISANNNIKRIQKSISIICEKFGSKINDYYAFPTLQQLSKISEEQFRECGVGFRAKYLVNTIKALKNIDLNDIKSMKLVDAIKFLTSLTGIGPKVADCILLFAYYNMEVFPVDTWIRQVYNCYFNEKENNENNCNLIRNFLTEKFKNLSGYAQQYLFYYKREMDK